MSKTMGQQLYELSQCKTSKLTCTNCDKIIEDWDTDQLVLRAYKAGWIVKGESPFCSTECYAENQG